MGIIVKYWNKFYYYTFSALVKITKGFSAIFFSLFKSSDPRINKKRVKAYDQFMNDKSVSGNIAYANVIMFHSAIMLLGSLFLLLRRIKIFEIELEGSYKTVLVIALFSAFAFNYLISWKGEKYLIYFQNENKNVRWIHILAVMCIHLILTLTFVLLFIYS